LFSENWGGSLQLISKDWVPGSRGFPTVLQRDAVCQSLFTIQEGEKGRRKWAPLGKKALKVEGVSEFAVPLKNFIRSLER